MLEETLTRIIILSSLALLVAWIFIASLAYFLDKAYEEIKSNRRAISSLKTEIEDIWSTISLIKIPPRKESSGEKLIINVEALYNKESLRKNPQLKEKGKKNDS